VTIAVNTILVVRDRLIIAVAPIRHVLNVNRILNLMVIDVSDVPKM
jgi:hypothetical protein